MQASDAGRLLLSLSVDVRKLVSAEIELNPSTGGRSVESSARPFQQTSLVKVLLAKCESSWPSHDRLDARVVTSVS